jgi:hypothetical protein
MRRLTLGVFVLLVACSNPAVTTTEAPTTTTLLTTTTATTVPATSTTTAVPLATSPLNGMPVEDETLLARRVMAVKIDNHTRSRPQSGLDLASAVYELPVEGITRFIALFHHTDATYLGPIRSGRPSDGRLLNPLDATFAISGGQPWVQQQIRAEDIHLIGETPPAMFRISSRSAPHNLYGDTEQLRGIADARGYPNDPPPTMFAFGELPESAGTATQIAMDFGNNFVVVWTWDPASSNYLRNFGGSPAELMDRDGVRSPLTAETLVVILAERYTEQPPDDQGSAVPAMDTVGSGQAYVFAEGRMLSGTWQRESSADLITLTADDGTPLPVPPGYLWISIVPSQFGIEVS